MHRLLLVVQLMVEAMVMGGQEEHAEGALVMVQQHPRWRQAARQASSLLVLAQER